MAIDISSLKSISQNDRQFIETTLLVFIEEFETELEILTSRDQDSLELTTRFKRFVHKIKTSLGYIKIDELSQILLSWDIEHLKKNIEAMKLLWTKQIRPDLEKLILEYSEP